MIEVIDRQSKRKFIEVVAGAKWLGLLYQSRLGSILLRFASSRLVSYLSGIWQDTPWSKSSIDSFVRDLQIDMQEAVIPPGGFKSFNDFFARKLRPDARPIVGEKDKACMPADGRVLAIQDLQGEHVFSIKGVNFTLSRFLIDSKLVAKYANGSLLIVRLCPADYHRFHFPCDGKPGRAKRIAGTYFSVNPLAIQALPDLFVRNERQVTLLDSLHFGTVAYVEVGATLVGRIRQTYLPGETVAKGDEKGYFEFGASTVVLLFEHKKIIFDEDLVANTYKGIETLCKMGSSLGRVGPGQTV